MHGVGTFSGLGTNQCSGGGTRTSAALSRCVYVSYLVQPASEQKITPMTTFGRVLLNIKKSEKKYMHCIKHPADCLFFLSGIDSAL